jgi:formylglycine-generating enzyme required for sulfatase activity
MADIFISYSKKHAQLTEDLARDLEAEGYTTWWDTGLLPDDVFFPETIRAEIAAAKAVIVIWAEHSITSRWVYSEANEGDKQGKLLQVRDTPLDPHRVPMPFNSGNIPPIADRAKIFAALARRGIAPSNKRPSPSAAPVPPPIGPQPHFNPARSNSADEGRVRVIVGVEQVARPAWLMPGESFRDIAGVGQGARETWLKPGESFRDLDIAPEMAVVPPGEFLMGSLDRERPQHKVTIPQAFAVGKYPVTFAEWDAAVASRCLSYEPGDEGWGRGRRPVINVSWDDAQAYVKWLSQKTGQPYRLLSEAEWEYACRAGSKTDYFFGDSEKDFGDYAWYTGNAGGRTHPVGEKRPNAFGLYDMHGNVSEWCEDRLHDSYAGKPENLNANAAAWTTGNSGRRVLRSGSWGVDPRRAADRHGDYPEIRHFTVGFRLARTLKP